MKKIILLSTITAATLFATNGDHMIGLGAESRALGGTGIANFIGAQNALTNPAVLAKTKSTNEFSFGGTIFKADVSIKTTAGNGTNGSTVPGTGTSRTSDEGKSMIPVIALSQKISDNVVFGLGMYGTAGMGTDWRDSDTPYQSDISNPGLMNIGLYNMRSSLMLMQFAPSLSYGTEKFGIGATAIMQYGQLSIDYDTYDSGNSYAKKHVGNGTSNDFGYGYQVGAYFNPSQAITLGAVYKSSIDMEYKDQISQAALAFGYGSHAGALAAKSDHLEQPSEIGIGISFAQSHMTYTADIKEIKWADAKGYKDFGWENQIVYALGIKHTNKNYWGGIGYNYAKNPIPNNTSSTSVAGGANTDGDTMNLFNYAMFPAIVEKAYTLGGGYQVTKHTMIDIAYTYSPKSTKTVSGQTVGVGYITTSHSQNATTVAVKYTF